MNVVDCCVHNRWSSASELAAYLSPGWREYIGRPGLFPGGRGMAPLVPPAGWSHPDSEWRAGAPAADPASLEAMRGPSAGPLKPTTRTTTPTTPTTSPAACRLPPAWWEKVFYRSALRAYGWSEPNASR